MKIDAHQHFWNPARGDYGWMPADNKILFRSYLKHDLEPYLKKLGIEVKSALPGVGENLRDHYAPRMKWSTLKGRYTYNDRARGIGIAREIAKYFTTRRGFLAMPAAPMRAYVRSREGLSAPDLGISVNPFLIKSGVSLDKSSGFTMCLKRWIAKLHVLLCF